MKLKVKNETKTNTLEKEQILRLAADSRQPARYNEWIEMRRQQPARSLNVPCGSPTNEWRSFINMRKHC